jgi:hypothetical protein
VTRRAAKRKPPGDFVKDACPLLPAPARGAGKVDSGGRTGATATYSWAAGVALRGGPRQRHCDGDASGWTGPSPRCEDVDDCAGGGSDACDPHVDWLTAVWRQKPRPKPGQSPDRAAATGGVLMHAWRTAKG